MEDVEGAGVELSHEQRKEEEQAVIQKKIEETEAQIEKLDMMETGAGLKDMTLQELAVNPRFYDKINKTISTKLSCWNISLQDSYRYFSKILLQDGC